MNSTVDANDDDPATELRDLARQLRGQLRRHAVLGAWAAPGGPTARAAGGDLASAGDGAMERDADGATPRERGRRVGAANARGDELGPGGEIARGSGGRDPAESVVGGDAKGAGRGEVARGRGERAARDVAHGAAATLALPVVDDEAIAARPRRSLAQVREELGECTRCKLHATRKKIVFGVGSEDARLVFVGEGPGEQEDLRGEPFVGRAGELLDKMIEAMGWTRDTVYIANTVKCRPPKNRNPEADELAACAPFLNAQLTAIGPRIIVALGRPAANQLLNNNAPISTLRGRFHDRAGVRVMPTFHPAYLLRDPSKKRDAWGDLKLVITELERLGIEPPNPPRV